MSIEGSVRKCLVKKWEDNAGYGFNLHAEMGKAGHYVGKVDENSPAEAAGLKDGDKIVEVNGTNIGNENHKQVVSRIKAGGDSVWLLVIDKEGDEYSKNNQVVVNADLPGVKIIECPDSRPGTETASEEKDNESSKSSIDNPEADYETPSELPPPVTEDVGAEANDIAYQSDEDLPPPPPELSELDAAVNSANIRGDSPPPEPAEPEVTTKQSEEVIVEPPAPTPAEPPAKEVEEPVRVEEVKAEEPPAPAAAPQNGSADNSSTPSSEPVPKMSAAEMREALSRKKKADPRKDNKALSAKDKLRMFQNL